MTALGYEILPRRDQSPRHKWGEPVTILPTETHDGNEHTERICIHCKLVKITVHPPHGFPWRQWRTREGKIWHGASTPPCLVQEVAAI